MSYSFALALSLLGLPAGSPSAASDSIRSDAAIRSVVTRHAAAVRKCYETEGLGRNPQLAGSVEITVTILPTGVVSDVEVSTIGLRGIGETEVSRCLAAVARAWKFDRGPYIVESIVLPFDLVRNAPPARKTVIAQRAAD